MPKADLERMRNTLVRSIRRRWDVDLVGRLRDSYEGLFRSLAGEFAGTDLRLRDEVISQCNITMLNLILKGEEFEGANFTSYLVGSLRKRIPSAVLSGGKQRPSRRKLKDGSGIVGDLFEEMRDAHTSIPSRGFEDELIGRKSVVSIIHDVESRILDVKEIGHIDGRWKRAARDVLHMMLMEDPPTYEEMAEIVSGDRRFGKTTVWLMVGRIRRMTEAIIDERSQEFERMSR